MTTVAIIDDQHTSREVLQQLISTIAEDIDVASFADPVEALGFFRHNIPDLVLTDYKMPRINGIEFIRAFRGLPECNDVPLIMITGLEDKHVRYQALDVGATDFLTKPVDHYECRARCNNLLALRRQQLVNKDRAKWLERQVWTATRETRDREKETLLRLAKAGEYRDEGTGNHIIRMAKYSRLIAEALGMPEDQCNIVEWAAPMHDIGKIGVGDAILLKPDKHTSGESEQMKKHTLIGYEILKESPSQYLQMGSVIALGHHERFNGSGYPHGLQSEEIPLPARIVAVGDVFDALTSERPYKKAWPLQETMNYVKKEKGSHFDPECVDAFFKQITAVIDIYNQLSDVPVAQSG